MLIGLCGGTWVFPPEMLSFTPPIGFSSAIASITTKISQMGHEKSQLIRPKSDAVPNFRFCNVSGRKTELIEIHPTNPRFHILFVPGNPGVISFYTDFLESLYEQMGEAASITAIGHISHSEKDWEHGNVFTLKEQIDHKINFIEQELQDLKVPLILVGHSIGSFMSLEIFKQIPEKVAYFIALYPFLAVNARSQQQSIIKKISRSRLQSNLISATVALLGFLPISVSRFIAKMSLGKSWSATAIDALCKGVLKYHTMCNVLYLAMTEFEELVKVPDWEFMRKKKNKIAFLYGDNDHWAPLYMHDEVVKQVPDAVVEVEKEGHTHSFCCTVSGSVWVARHVATLINKTIL
ncbi:putative lipid droplet-associated hydrolase, alpha/Beta hydrolase [Helianthus debilis subsp. tardiflorus]